MNPSLAEQLSDLLGQLALRWDYDRAAPLGR